MKFEHKKNYLFIIPLKMIELISRFTILFKRRKKSKKILLMIDVGHFGDQLMLTPAIKHLRESENSKDYQIYCITTHLGEKALKNNPDIDKVFVVNKNWDSNYNNFRWIKNYFNLKSLIQNVNPEVAFSCRSTAYHIETLAIFNSNISFRYGYSGKGLKKLLTNTLKYDLHSHRVDQNIDLIRLFTKSKSTISKKPYFYPDLNNVDTVRMNSYVNDLKLVLINVFAEHDYIYNLDFYLNVVKHYEEKGFKVLFIGVEKNRIKVDKFLIKNGIGSNSNLLGKTNIDELYYLLSKSKLLITIDTGVRHLANCLELPIISFRKTPNYDSEFGKYLPSETIYNEEHNRLKYANTSNSVEKLNYKMLCKEFNR